MAVAAKLAEAKEFLFVNFPNRVTLTTTNYDRFKDRPSVVMEKSKVDRMAGYNNICKYALGSAFLSAASGVLSHLEEQKDPDVIKWIERCTVYFAVALVTMLTGFAASSFPDSYPIPYCLAGLGAWQGFLFVLATFHIASLKFHSNVQECGYSMMISTMVVSFCWGYGVQDPLPLHILVKFIIWFVGLLFFAVGFLCYCFCCSLIWLGRVSCDLLMACGGSICKGFNSLKDGLAARLKKPPHQEKLLG